jgi:hypothetical protein
MAVDLIVIHLSCSSWRVSVNRASPAFAAEIIPARWTRESVRVDLPWSTKMGVRQCRTQDEGQDLGRTMRNDRHVADVCRTIHQLTDLGECQ